MKNRRIIILSGVPGVGKSTLLKKIKEARPNLLFSRSCTDRPPRPEEDSNAYEYISSSEFEAGIRDDIFLEYVYEGGIHYGTRKSTLENLADGARILMDLDTQGGLSILHAYPDDTLLIFIYAPKEVVANRLRSREEGRMPPEVINNRLARWDAENIRAVQYHYIVENTELDICLEQLLSIIDNNHEYENIHSNKHPW